MATKGYTPLDLEWMQYALNLAARAREAGEVPVGAVLIKDNTVIGEGWNTPISGADPTAHAEIVAIRNAATNLNNYRLTGSTLYVTIEPCTMCIGATIHARIQRVVFGASEPRAGAVQSQLQLLDSAHYNHRIEWLGGVLAEPCSEIISAFFRDKRGG